MKRTRTFELKGALDPEETQGIVGGISIYRDMLTAGWLVPVIKIQKMTRFDAESVLAAWKRLCDEGIHALREAAAENARSISESEATKWA